MDGRAFLEVARELSAGASEAHWRSTAGRAYYALLHECLSALHRWGFPPPPRDKVHHTTRNRLIYATDPDLKHIGLTLEELGLLRNRADYELVHPGRFQTGRRAQAAVVEARDAIALLDAIEADPARRAATIASIRP